MTRRLLLSACCCLVATFASAAIITERNDVYNGIGCYTPPAYTFIGTPSRPGIESCWIPYGTYTDGVGGTEYTRVTSNLMGVVASMLGGYSERYQISVLRDNPMMRPVALPEGHVSEGYWWYIDDGALLSSQTNCSLRISDQLNLPLIYVSEYDYTNYHYSTSTSYDSIELAVLKCALSYYGSRRLEAITGNAAPPISSEWSPNLPYNVADSNLWRNVYPALCFCTNDLYFLTNGEYSRRRCLPDPNSGGLWGHDFGQSLSDLQSALVGMPLDVTIEDVLSYDTGWKYEVPPVCTSDWWTVSGPVGNLDLREYHDFQPGRPFWDNISFVTNYYVDILFIASESSYTIHIVGMTNDYYFSQSTSGDKDSEYLNFGEYHATRTRFYSNEDDYTHWTNGTTRLDWKRLGIICQLERQMDTTYDAYQYGDTLPLWHLDTLHELWYESSPISITFPIPQGDGQEMPLVTGLLRNVSWNNDYNHYSSTTNDYKTIWSTPTCRTPAPQCAGEMYFDGYLGTDIYLGYEDASNIISKICSELSQSITGELSQVRFYGDWSPGAGMNLDFNAYYAEGKSIIKHPSNTVEVTSSDGFHANWWTSNDWDSVEWNPSDGTNYFYVNFHLGYMSFHDDQIIITCEAPDFEQESGSVTIPQMTLTAIGTGDVSNWTWQVSGWPNISTNCVFSIEAENYVWTLGDYAGGIGNGGYVVYSTYGEGDMGVDLQTIADGRRLAIHADGLERARSLTTPSVTLTWNADYYTTEEEVSYSGQLQGDSIPIHWNPANTNATGYAYSTIHKTTSPTFTFASPETRALTISNFSWKNSPLDWSRIHSLRRSELEMLLSARGVPGFASDTNAYDPSAQPFTWEATKNIPHSDRMFRMLQGTSATTLSNADNAQYNFLASLSSICKQECAEIGGMPIEAIDDVGKVSQSESAAFLADFKNAKVGATFSISGSSGEVFQADVHLEGDSYVVDAIDTPVHFPYYVGGCEWGCYVDYEQSASITNQYRDARVDAHQAPVRKTVWKFKNLRDPNL